MTTAREHMARRVVTFAPDSGIHSAIRVLLKRHISGAPVLDKHGALVGMLSKRDCLEVAFRSHYHGQHAGRVAEYMRSEVHTIDPDMDIVEIAQLFLKLPFRRFPVLEDGRLVGQISRHDVLLALEELW